MKLRNTRENPSRSAIARRAGALPITALLVTGALTGCSSNEGGAFDEFIGIWSIDVGSTFDLTCPPPNAANSQDFPVWNQMVIEAGTVTDLVELAGPCPFNFNVAGKIASTADPDPFTAQSPICRFDVGMVRGTLFADIQPSWEFRLLAPEKGKAPTAQLVDVNPISTFTLVPFVGGVAQPPDPACTYLVQANLTKIAQF